ncbi:hypothetical protein Tco_1263993 [Tanacetum coccineum]
MDKGLTELSDVALTEAKKLKLVIERSKTQTHNSHASGSGADEGTGVKPGVPDVPSYNSDDEQISWKSSDEEDDDEVSLNDDDDDVANQDDDNEKTDLDNDGDDFVHPKFSTHDDDAKQDEEVNEEDSFDPRVQTPSHVESSDDESNEEVQGANNEEEEMEEEATHEEDEANELYRDVNVNLEGRDTTMTDAPLPNVQATQETEDTHVILTAPINPEDVPVTTIADPPLVSATTLPPPPTPLITHMQQTPVPTPTTVSSSFTQNLPNFGRRKANDDDEVSSDQRVSTSPDYELTEEEEDQEGNDNAMGGEEEEEELYGDLNLNLERRDVEMTNAQTNQDTEDTHMTLTAEPPLVQQQSSSISSDLVSKFINPSSDTGIDSILNPNIQSDTLVNVSVFVSTETPSSETTIPQPQVPIIHPLQQTPASITTTNPTMTLPKIPNFASLFGFEQRVSALETELSKFKQTSQFAEVVSSISGIVDNYLASKLKDAMDVAVQLQSDKLREEAQAENDEFLNKIDSNIKAIIKDQVKGQVSKILTKIEQYVTESLGAEVLVRSTSQPQTSYAVATSLSEFKLKKILIDKIDENKSMNRSEVQRKLYNALIESYNSDKDLFTSYGDVVTLKRGRDDQDKDEDPSAGSN